MNAQLDHCEPHYKSVDLATLFKISPLEWLVHEILPGNGLSFLYGEAGCGKTFLAIDIAGAVARGVAWAGKPTQKGAVLYVATEDFSGLSTRMRAYCKEHSLDVLSMPFRLWREGLNLLDLKSVGNLVNEARLIADLRLIVIDTFAAAMPGDENASNDVGKAIRSLNRIKQGSQTSILVLHHTGKDETKGMRGWSGLKGATDTIIRVRSAQAGLSATVEKHRNWHSGEKIHFRLAARVIDSQDFESVSCVVEHVGEQGSTKVLTDLQKSILDAHAEFNTECSGGCTMEVLVDLVVARGAKSNTGATSNKGNIRRSIKGLVDQRLLTLSG
jgi:KaiC/GvpD/RAD55 family RecA-like ATPase